MKDCTLHEATQAYLEHLRVQGKKERTLFTYSKDCEQIEAFFGADKKVRAILVPHVSKFLKSDALLRLPKGKDRAKPTVDKTIRVLRMLLEWAKDTGRIAKLPLPKNLPMGRSKGKQRDESIEVEHKEVEVIPEACAAG